ncbi:MAG: hypothetical protein EOP87_09845, partial [Verrucomicrobiaceae bacterium]
MTSNRLPRGFLLLLFTIVAWLPASAEEAALLSLARLREAASAKERMTLSFRVEGVVRAIGANTPLIVVDDGFTTDLLEVALLPPELRPGNRVVIHGSNCLVSRGPLAIRVGNTPVVDIDGLHSPLARSGKVFLTEGLKEMRVEWFNGNAEGVLDLEYECAGEGESLTRRKVPPEAFSYREAGTGSLKPGLEYVSYIEDDLKVLPDFSRLPPVKRGVVPDLDPRVRSRPDMAALVFSGFIAVPVTGVYQFHLTSDDGARLYVSDAPVAFEITGNEPLVHPASALKPGTLDRWVSFKGTVNYATKVEERLELEVTGSSQTFHVVVADGDGLDAAGLLHKGVTVAGIRKNMG